MSDIDYRLGRAVGWREGYRAGFTAGVDIGAAGLLLAIEHALPAGVLLDLLPNFPYAGEYRRIRDLRRVDNQPCTRDCGSCSTCIRAAAVLRNLDRYDATDYPGGPVSWSAPATRRGAA